MSATTLTPRRALRQPRQIDWRAIVGILLMLITISGSFVFWASSSDTRSVIVITHDVPAGATLGPQDLATARVRVDDAIYRAAIPATDLDSLVGRQVAEPLYANQLLVRAQLSSRPRLGAGQVALTIAISPDTAVGGTLRAGDQVEVLLTTNKGKPEAQTTVVLPRVTVYDVGYTQTIAAVGASSTDTAPNPDQIRSLTLVVSQDQAVQLAHAKWAGDLDVALLPPGQDGDVNAGRTQPKP